MSNIDWEFPIAIAALLFAMMTPIALAGAYCAHLQYKAEMARISTCR